MGPIEFLIAVAALVIGVGAGFFIRKTISESKISSAEAEAGRIVEEAQRRAQAEVKDSELTAREQAQKLREDAETEVKERRSEVLKLEDRLVQREEQLESKFDHLQKRDEALDEKESTLTAEKSELEESKGHIRVELERVAGLSSQEAKDTLLRKIEEETKHEAAKMIKDIEAEAKEESDRRARNIIGLAIQRCASDHAAEMTVSVLNLPSEDMKGRIIGREGRNIRAFESLTGVNLIIDDTPDSVILSGFDPVRREIARLTLEKLVVDGRIHPARIEELFEKSSGEVEAKIREAGEQAAFDTGVHGLHPELIKVLGRLRYRTSYGQNVLNHTVECSHLAGLMAAELGSDIKLAKRAALLHDLGKAVDHEVEGSHAVIGADLARKHGESEAIVHAIQAHHADVEPQTIEAVLVQAADALSASRPGARRETLENYVKRLQELERICVSYPGVEKAFAMQAGRDVRVMVKPEQVDDATSTVLARDIAKQIENDLQYPGQIRVTVIRESRAVEYAK